MRTRKSWSAAGVLLAVAVAIGFAPPHPHGPAAAPLAQRPPMGWNSWNHFRLNITDAIIRTQAAAMVSSQAC